MHIWKAFQINKHEIFEIQIIFLIGWLAQRTVMTTKDKHNPKICIKDKHLLSQLIAFIIRTTQRHH